jgi:hypothetical protein
MNRRTLLLLLGASFGLIPFWGCATIVKGSEQKVLFQTDPNGASVAVYDADGMKVAAGQTPITLPLIKGDGFFKAAKYRVVFETPGYAKREIWISGELEGGWYIAGNLLVGGWIGWLIVDPLTGAMWRLSPENITADLDKNLASTDGEGLKIVLADQLPAELLARATALPQKL